MEWQGRWLVSCRARTKTLTCSDSDGRIKCKHSALAAILTRTDSERVRRWAHSSLLLPAVVVVVDFDPDCCCCCCCCSVDEVDEDEWVGASAWIPSLLAKAPIVGAV